LILREPRTSLVSWHASIQVNLFFPEHSANQGFNPFFFFLWNSGLKNLVRPLLRGFLADESIFSSLQWTNDHAQEIFSTPTTEKIAFFHNTFSFFLSGDAADSSFLFLPPLRVPDASRELSFLSCERFSTKPWSVTRKKPPLPLFFFHTCSVQHIPSFPSRATSFQGGVPPMNWADPPSLPPFLSVIDPPSPPLLHDGLRTRPSRV